MRRSTAVNLPIHYHRTHRCDGGAAARRDPAAASPAVRHLTARPGRQTTVATPTPQGWHSSTPQPCHGERCAADRSCGATSPDHVQNAECRRPYPPPAESFPARPAAPPPPPTCSPARQSAPPRSPPAGRAGIATAPPGHRWSPTTTEAASARNCMLYGHVQVALAIGCGATTCSPMPASSPWTTGGGGWG